MEEIEEVELVTSVGTSLKALSEADVTSIKPFWLVWRNASWRITHKHQTADSALTEAVRLSKLFPDRKFYVLQVVAQVRGLRSSLNPPGRKRPRT